MEDDIKQMLCSFSQETPIPTTKELTFYKTNSIPQLSDWRNFRVYLNQSFSLPKITEESKNQKRKGTLSQNIDYAKQKVKNRQKPGIKSVDIHFTIGNKGRKLQKAMSFRDNSARQKINKSQMKIKQTQYKSVQQHLNAKIFDKNAIQLKDKNQIVKLSLINNIIVRKNRMKRYSFAQDCLIANQMQIKKS